jgi:hypothetical protein
MPPTTEEVNAALDAQYDDDPHHSQYLSDPDFLAATRDFENWFGRKYQHTNHDRIWVNGYMSAMNQCHEANR